ncbi:hypothetical protein FisN_15Lh088 [Fistulifera solaris]|uniref:DOT1 domain-containing protein n=1 Tax=Fistulifera solaris TaxID=1519565 RepID=A0A1Z5KBB3_FISSO|nr:hypothetical protein FisN_15Lh088 [Fistulifera solaris]|eukprot:GAX23371.1 hypothetical protein FisN_15Lh088 [Fistulifera solaris]
MPCIHVIVLEPWLLLCLFGLLQLHLTAVDSLSLVMTTATTILSRPKAATVIDEILFPQQEYGQRIALGRRAQGISADHNDGSLLQAKDERLYQTYGEFPLSSLDYLLDRALSVSTGKRLSDIQNDGLNVVDLGSGCGRLVYYLGLSRPNWIVHGIEMSPLLHEEALVAQDRALSCGLLRSFSSPSPVSTPSGRISFYQGKADKWSVVLEKADIVFAYSTAWECQGLSPETGTMILSDEWNQLFTEYCSEAIVITTDRSLNANEWTIIDRLEVPNPEVWNSMGYLQVHRNENLDTMQKRLPLHNNL